MTDTNEEFTFRIGLSGTYWNRKPEFLVTIQRADGSVVAGMTEPASITLESGAVEYVAVSADLPDGDYELCIALCNKQNTDVVKAADGSLAKDMLLNIESIEIDGIDLGTLCRSASIYKLKNAQQYNGETITELKNCVNLGWNGSYTLAFTAPIHYWLLENL